MQSSKESTLIPGSYHGVYQSYLRRGRLGGPRRRSGQVKAVERYVRRELAFVRGGSLCDMPRGNCVIPSIEVTQHLLPIIEEICVNYAAVDTQVIMLETVLRRIQDFNEKPSHSKTTRRLHHLIFDNLGCYVLLNEQNSDMYSFPRISPTNGSIESATAHSYRLIAASCLYLRITYGLSITIILYEDDPMKTICEELGIPTTRMEDIVDRGVQLRALPPQTKLELMELMQARRRSQIIAPPGMELTEIGSEEQYSPHYSMDEIEKGLRSGELLKGTLTTYRHNPFDGEVDIQSNEEVSLVLLSGRFRMNRGLNGDTVVIRILPEEELRSFDVNVHADDDDEEEEDAEYGEEERGAVSGVPYGHVVGVLRRCVDQIICGISLYRSSPAEEKGAFIQSDREEAVLIAPLDRRLPKIRIRTRQRRLLENQRFLVAIDQWPRDSKFPNGHFLRLMGSSGDWRVEVECLLLENGLAPKQFSTQALACLPCIAQSAKDNQVLTVQSITSTASSPVLYAIPSPSSYPDTSRRDLRESRFVFSVDPPGCQDIDDAMSIEWLDDGRVEVAVHIADVCAFLPPNSPLDLEARERATTIYLTHQRFDMLPSVISSDLASLHCGVDRLCVSVAWNIDISHADGRPVLASEDVLDLDVKNDLQFLVPEMPSWAGRARIHSMAAATYRQAHNIIYDIAFDEEKEKCVQRGQAGGFISKDLKRRLKKDLRALTAFGRFLQRSRESSGALDLSQGVGAELKFKIDSEGNPVEVEGKEELEIHHTISELMIVANSAVARMIHNVFPMQTLLRIHPPPSATKLKLLQEEIQQTGIDAFQQSKTTTELRNQLKSYRETVSRRRGKNTSDLVEIMTTAVIRAMNEAKYVSSSSLTGDLLVLHTSESAADGYYMGHYGLGLKFYTHFTSPIRRYADIIAHRQLIVALNILTSQAASDENLKDTPKYEAVGKVSETLDDNDFLDSLLDGVGDELLPNAHFITTYTAPVIVESSNERLKLCDPPFSASELVSISDHLNIMNRKSKSCQMSCQKLFLCLYFSTRTERHRAIVYSLREYGFMVFVPSFNYKGRVYLSKRDSQSNQSDAYVYTLTRNDSKITNIEFHKKQKSLDIISLCCTEEIIVELSCDSTRLMRDLVVNFIAKVEDDSMLEEMNNKSTFGSFVKSVVSTEANAASLQGPSCSAVEINNVSLRQALQQNKVFSRINFNANKKSKLEKLNSQFKDHRHWIRNSGRLSFCSADLLTPVFKFHESDANFISAPQAAGYNSAVSLMKRWGEEWAEEEDLPTSSTAGGVAGEVFMTSDILKEISISSQRQSVIKAAKRKSRLNG